jgi:hypothetical protein
MTEASRILLARKDRDAEATRTLAIWKARRSFWFDSWDAEPHVMGGYRPSIAEQLRQLRVGR